MLRASNAIYRRTSYPWGKYVLAMLMLVALAALANHLGG